MIVLKNLEIEESLIKPSVILRKDHECAYCGKVILKADLGLQVSFRYDLKLYSLYFHSGGCFQRFRQLNITSEIKPNPYPLKTDFPL